MTFKKILSRCFFKKKPFVLLESASNAMMDDLITLKLTKLFMEQK